MAAGRMLAANGFANDRDAAIFRYNNDNRYVRAVTTWDSHGAAIPSSSTYSCIAVRIRSRIS